ncbi:hypothetical protein CAPTEDRAFT_210574 [Capitella teleta]|uniref:Uncharacterized protein n=1 Tax=Capitella teleta TaxID=283909 RepID=R7TPQ4_CAPTE|nr:hypothetical protein CAPTEDRAFT_210574 [Capitella teleta]|eukprot:ELT93030.1 hypothetical protein CAPTEDRAFT_210574 [Capitella teleta]
MAYLHPMSCECLKSELDLFSMPPTQTSIIGGQWVEYQPLSSLSTAGPIEFSISGSGDDYVDFSQSWLYVAAKVTKADDTNLDATASIAPVNNWLHSLFSQIDLSLNDTLVTTSNNTYPYRAYIENLLTFDTVGKFDGTPSQANDGQNRGQDARRRFTAQWGMHEKRLFHATGKLGLDAGNGIGRSDYVGNGYALHVLDLSPDLSDGNHLELREKGTVGLEIHFATALPNTINVVVYSEFENLIEVDRNRRVIFDYAN